MIAAIIRVILGGLWKPIAAILGALGVYFKGRSDAKAKRTAQDAKAYRETNERVSNETDSTDPDDVVRQRLRDRAKR
jgi:hypothetical protein